MTSPYSSIPQISGPTKFVSQSECAAAIDCGLAWYAKWCLGLQSNEPESLPQRVGSLGHAVVEDAVISRVLQRPHSPIGAMVVEALRRGYITPADAGNVADADLEEDLPTDWQAAMRGAETLLASPDFQPRRLIINPATGEPLVEERIYAPWHHLDVGIFAGLVSLRSNRLGMEGTPDIVHEDEDVVYVDDYKFRQKPDLGGTSGEPDSGFPDNQGAFYKVLLHGAKIGIGREVIFRQLNVYAGAWLALDDFLREDSPYVTAHGLPSRDLKKMEALVTAEVWEEAWRALVERRRNASAHAVTANGKSKPIRMSTPNEQGDARIFVETLKSIPLVQVVQHRLDTSVCYDVVRDMLAAVDARLAHVDAGVTPPRNLRTWHRSPCTRPWGCQVQAPCRAALGTGRIRDVLDDMREDGRLRLAVHQAVGDHPLARKAATP